MPDQPFTVMVGNVPARLEPDAIGVAQDTVIGMATLRPGCVDRPDPCRPSRGDRLRQRSRSSS